MTSSTCTSVRSAEARPTLSSAPRPWLCPRVRRPTPQPRPRSQTVFQGTTLRGLLLEAYGFSLIAEIAFWCAIAAFALAGIMAVLVGLGFAHARRTGEDEELMPSHAPHGALVNA